MRANLRSIGLAAGCLLAACGGKATPTYYKDVEPIVQTKCDACHVQNNIAPFTLTSYDEVTAKAKLIKPAVDARIMPPWPPGKDSPPMLHSRGLTDTQIATIDAWIDGGMPRGDPKDHVDRTPDLPQIKPDQTLSMAEPYTPDATLTDDYRCFIIDPGVTTKQEIIGHNILPGQPREVHHVILYEVLQAGVAQVQQEDASDPGPGYQCFGGPMAGSSSGGGVGNVRFLGGWAPGVGAVQMPNGTGLPLYPGAVIVMQVHYNLANGHEPDVTQAQLQYAPDPGNLTEALVFPIVNDSFSVPPGAAPPDPASVVTQSWPMSLLANYGVASFKIYNVFPHMHLRGAQISMDVTHQDGTRQTLIDIPRWDFHWQGGYDLAQPVVVKQTDTLGLKCVYDNSAANQPVIGGVQQQPKTLTWGEGTNDEMCIGFYYVTIL